MNRRDRILGLLLHADHWMTPGEIRNITHGGFFFTVTLLQLEIDGLVESQWETDHGTAYPRNRLYRLSTPARASPEQPK